LTRYKKDVCVNCHLKLNNSLLCPFLERCIVIKFFLRGLVKFLSYKFNLDVSFERTNQTSVHFYRCLMNKMAATSLNFGGQLFNCCCPSFWPWDISVKKQYQGIYISLNCKSIHDQLVISASKGFSVNHVLPIRPTNMYQLLL
jgi:hypothetical protein